MRPTVTMQTKSPLMDTKTIVVNSLNSAFRLMRIDLNTLPEDAFSKCFGGKARTVADIVHEVNMVNDRELTEIRGETPGTWPEGWVVAPADLQTKQQVIDAFEGMVKRTLDTAESFTSDQLEETIKVEESETTRFAKFRFIALHTWYHSGQLNFIQTLLGDDEFHWAK